MCKRVSKSLVVPALLLTSCVGYAAQPIDLESKPISTIKSLVAQPLKPAYLRTAPGPLRMPAQSSDLKEVKRSTDFNGTTHIRMQQTVKGYPVFGGDAVVHVRKPHLAKRSIAMLAATPDTGSTDMNGVVYEGLDQDLASAPASVFTESQAKAATAKALKLANQQYAKGSPKEANSKLMVFVDEDNQAHWAFLTNLYFAKSVSSPAPSYPHYILDAQTLKVYKQWNGVVDEAGDEQDLRNAKLDNVDGGGYGGNPTAGTLVYDGLANDLGKLAISRNSAKKTCYLLNPLAEVHDTSRNDVVANFACKKADVRHNGLYWDGKLHSANGGYSPDNDAFYAGSVVKSLYKDWYNVDMLVDSKGKAMKLKLFTHAGDDWENAVWDGRQEVIYLGDGADNFYPLTSLGVIAHEVSHGFTQQHSNLVYRDQSGALNEAFSDMAAQAAEYFANGQSSWQIGSEISKVKGSALRYLDRPSKDCAPGSKAGDDCSIDTMSDYANLIKNSKKLPAGNYRDGYVVHLASGLYNRVFYLIATADGWNSRKAFEVMLQANANYWTPTTNFKKAACGVLSATKDHGYKTDAVKAAFKTVGVDTAKC